MDRNNLFANPGSTELTSLSARRAWIEIACFVGVAQGSVASLSARRAWIEIGLNFARKIRLVVALRKESVDRNL